MATKTITLDLEAYEALRRRKEKGESFSDVVKRYFSGGVTGRELLRILDHLDLEEETLDRLDRLVEARREDQARAPTL